MLDTETLKSIRNMVAHYHLRRKGTSPPSGRFKPLGGAKSKKPRGSRSGNPESALSAKPARGGDGTHCNWTVPVGAETSFMEMPQVMDSKETDESKPSQGEAWEEFGRGGHIRICGIHLL